MKLKKVNQQSQSSDDNWDFDFSLYEKEEEQAESLQSLKKLSKPRITGLRSKFSPSMIQLENIEAIRTKISSYGIKVAARTQDINDLWKLYGCLDEYWARIHDIYGTIIINEINTLKTICFGKLIKAEEQSTINYNMHILLLTLRDKIYIAAQRANLGLEVEKSNFSHYDKAKKGITE